MVWKFSVCIVVCNLARKCPCADESLCWCGAIKLGIRRQIGRLGELGAFPLFPSTNFEF